jgi:hypothetical protein
VRDNQSYFLGTGQVIHVRDEKSSGANGGTFTSGSYQTRTINQVVRNTITGASLASNEITLPAGTFWIEARCPAWIVNTHKAKLRNITDSSDILIGTTIQGANNSLQANAATTYSFIRGLFTLSASKNLQIQHRCATTQSDTGFGQACSFGDIEIYTDAVIWKVNA